MRTTCLLLTAVLLTSAAGAGAAGRESRPDAAKKGRQLFARALAACGGLEAFENAETLVFRGIETRAVLSGEPIVTETYVQRPDRFRTLRHAPDSGHHPSVAVWDRGKGWVGHMYGEIKSDPGTKLAFDQWRTLDLLWLHREVAEGRAKPTYLGEKLVFGDPADVVQLKWAATRVEYSFRRADGRLVRALYGAGGVQEIIGRTYLDVRFGDYRDVGGPWLPFHIEYRQLDDTGSTLQMRVEYDSIEVNQELDDALFAQPEGNLTLPASLTDAGPGMKNQQKRP